jgi:hypothetical protein
MIINQNQHGFDGYEIQVNRKKIWKGTMAPKGFIFVCVRAKNKHNGAKYVIAQAFPGKLGPEMETKFAAGLMVELAKKYKFEGRTLEKKL